jgi:hypothetical protein
MCKEMLVILVNRVVDTKRIFGKNWRAEEEESRVARWFVFKPKIPIWVNFGGHWNGKCCYSLTIIWNILWPFAIMYGSLV